LSALTQPWSRRWATAALVALGAVVAVVGVVTLNEGYIDFGDGNYLYIAWRLSEGAGLYSDILSPQPPLHLHVGAALVWLGDRLGNATLTVRGALVLIHLLTGWLLYRLGRRWRFGRGTAVLACAVWWLCPIGYRWSIGWQSENLEIPFLLTALILLARRGELSLLLAGLAGAGALLCNMTAAPYVLFNGLFAVAAFRLRGLVYWLGLLGGWGAVALVFELATGAFFQNVILNQVGTYPADHPGGLLAYFTEKVSREGGSVLRVEGLWVALAVAGMAIAGLHARGRWRDFVTLHRGIYSVGALLSILYVTKGGTVDYIFCLGEPFVGLWAAHTLTLLANAEIVRSDSDSRRPRDFRRVGMAALIFALGCTQVAPWLWRFLTQRGYEWPEDRMAFVVDQIERHSAPGDLILAPPYFAFHTRRRLVEDFSSTYLWYIKYIRGDPEGVAMMERIGERIRTGEVALVALNGLSPQAGELIRRGETVPAETIWQLDRYVATILPLRAALFETCRPVGPRLQSNILQRRAGTTVGQEDLTFWVPDSAQRNADE
jgi:hypothetical protein